jgi:hypothetical protein
MMRSMFGVRHIPVSDELRPFRARVQWPSHFIGPCPMLMYPALSGLLGNSPEGAGYHSEVATPLAKYDSEMAMTYSFVGAIFFLLPLVASPDQALVRSQVFSTLHSLFFLCSLKLVNFSQLWKK